MRVIRQGESDFNLKSLPSVNLVIDRAKERARLTSIAVEPSMISYLLSKCGGAPSSFVEKRSTMIIINSE